MKVTTNKPVPWSVALQGDAHSGYEVELRFSQKLHRFQVASPPDIGEIPSLAGEDVRGPRAIDMLAHNASVEELRTIGRELYRFLCFDTAQQVDYGQQLQVLLDQAKAEKRSLAFRLDLSQAPDLAAVPWEALYSDSEKSFLATRELFGLTRVRTDQVAPPPDPVELPLKLLVVVADPTSTLDTKTEVDKLRELFDAHKSSATPIDARYLEKATRATFADMVFTWKPHVVHYIGHGEFDEIGSLWLHDTDTNGEIDRLNAEELRNVFDDRPPWMIVLNSCEGGVIGHGPGFGGLAQELMHNAIPFVIAMQSRITNQAAIIFAKGFYTALANREPVSHAVAGARNLLRVSLGGKKSAEMITPALYASSELDEILIAPSAAAVAPVTAAPPARERRGPGRYAAWGSLAASLVAVVIAGGVWVAGLNDAAFNGAESGTNTSARLDDIDMAETGEVPERVARGSRQRAVRRSAPASRGGHKPAYAGFEGHDVAYAEYEDYESAYAQLEEPLGSYYPGERDGSGEPPEGSVDFDRWAYILGGVGTDGRLSAIRGRTTGMLPFSGDCRGLSATLTFAATSAWVSAADNPEVARFAEEMEECDDAQVAVGGDAHLPGDGPGAAALAFHRTHAAALALVSAGVDPSAIIEFADWESAIDESRNSVGEPAASRTATVQAVSRMFVPIEVAEPIDGPEARELYAAWGAVAAGNPEVRLAVTAWNAPMRDHADMAAVGPMIAAGIAEAQAQDAREGDPAALTPTVREAREPASALGTLPPFYIEARFNIALAPFVWTPGDDQPGDLDRHTRTAVDAVSRLDAAAEERQDGDLVDRILLEGHSLRGIDDGAARQDALAAVAEVADQLTKAGLDSDRFVVTACGARRRDDIPAGADRAVAVSVLPALVAGPQRACGWNERFWAGEGPVEAPTIVLEPPADR